MIQLAEKSSGYHDLILYDKELGRYLVLTTLSGKETFNGGDYAINEGDANAKIKNVREFILKPKTNKNNIDRDYDFHTENFDESLTVDDLKKLITFSVVINNKFILFRNNTSSRYYFKFDFTKNSIDKKFIEKIRIEDFEFDTVETIKSTLHFKTLS